MSGLARAAEPLTWWQTYGPAVIAAGAALVIVVVDRIWAATRERDHSARTARTATYATFFGAAKIMGYYITETGPDGKSGPEGTVAVAREVADALGLMLLIAPDEVVSAAQEYIAQLTKWQEESPHESWPDAVTAAEDAFVRAARIDA